MTRCSQDLPIGIPRVFFPVPPPHPFLFSTIKESPCLMESWNALPSLWAVPRLSTKGTLIPLAKESWSFQIWRWALEWLMPDASCDIITMWPLSLGQGREAGSVVRPPFLTGSQGLILQFVLELWLPKCPFSFHSHLYRANHLGWSSPTALVFPLSLYGLRWFSYRNY